MEKKQIQCPQHCHACCKSNVVQDITAVESLIIYLLNRDIIDLVDQHTALHNLTGYCPFLIQGKCIINAYKPTACQMYMPFEIDGNPVCFYIAEKGSTVQPGSELEYYMNSNSYAIHGFMMIIQADIDADLSQTCFKNIDAGISWWQVHCDSLPDATRGSLESILNEDRDGLQRIHDFQYEQSLYAGYQRYSETLKQH
jgi:Fe-S-cluster containining protein